MIIALTGEKLAGKGTVSDYLVQHYAGKTFKFSQPLSDIAQRLHLANSRHNLVQLGTALRQYFSDTILGEVLQQDLLASTAAIKVVDGMRYSSEYDLLKHLPDFHLVYVTAPVMLRYQRTKLRTEKNDETTMTETEFQQRENDITERQIQQLGQLAEVTIDNIGTLQELYDKIDLSLPHVIM